MGIFTGPAIAIAQGQVNKLIEPYGAEMKNLDLDSEEKNVTFDIKLKGEREPIRFTVTKYDIVKKKAKTYVLFHKLSASKQWVQAMIDNALLPNYAPDNRIEIPSSYGWILKILVYSERLK